ncbi:hypothetical protein [Mesorhizobium sp. CN2-181]|uniref:hypothetical protein n=1 Tax=Mesorhizobium yinganensis TaxID=3157707 RepID=UPI0032B7C003
MGVYPVNTPQMKIVSDNPDSAQQMGIEPEARTRQGLRVRQVPFQACRVLAGDVGLSHVMLRMIGIE